MTKFWVRLYIGDEQIGDVFPVAIPSKLRNVRNVKEAVKAKCQIDLAHCDAWRLAVYPPHTPVPPGADIKTINKDDNESYTIRNATKEWPLVIIAPENTKNRARTQVEDSRSYLCR